MLSRIWDMLIDWPVAINTALHCCAARDKRSPQVCTFATRTSLNTRMSANRLKLNADKTELLFAGSSHACFTMRDSLPVLQLGTDTAVASSHVRVSNQLRLLL